MIVFFYELYELEAPLEKQQREPEPNFNLTYRMKMALADIQAQLATQEKQVEKTPE